MSNKTEDVAAGRGRLTWRLLILGEATTRITLASRSRRGLATRLYTDSPSRSRRERTASARV